MEDPIVTLGGEEMRISAPASVAVRWEVVGFQGLNYPRAACAALAVCWRGGKRPKASLARHQYSVGAFGGAVLEELLERGLGFGEIIEAGGIALGVLSVGLVSAREVDDAEKHFPDEAGGAGPSDP